MGSIKLVEFPGIHPPGLHISRNLPEVAVVFRVRSRCNDRESIAHQCLAPLLIGVEEIEGFVIVKLVDSLDIVSTIGSHCAVTAQYEDKASRIVNNDININSRCQIHEQIQECTLA